MKFRLTLLVAILFAVPRLSFGECDTTALRTLDAANQSRGIVSDLELMKAWYRDVGDSMQRDYDEHGRIWDAEEFGVRQGTQWMWWSDNFGDFSVCSGGESTLVDLERSWWGAYARVEDLESLIGYELYYLRASDGLVFPGELEDYDYEWSQRIAGGSVWWRDWARVSMGTIDVAAPQRTAEPLHTGSIYLNLALPRFGLAADVITRPRARRLDTAMLALRRQLPWKSITASAVAGWIDDEQRAVAGLGIGILQLAAVDVVLEGAPIRLRSATLRIETPYRVVWGDEDFWSRADLTPFLEVSAFNSSRWEEATGRGLLPGVATGISASWLFAHVQVGIETFVGINRATELGRMLDVADRLQWGSRVYLRSGF